MKILLVNAIDEHRELQIALPHLGLAYIAAYLRENLSSVDVKIAERSVMDEILAFRPDLVGISALSQNFNIAKDISSFCKGLDIPVVVGGYHISALPTSLHTNMDIGVIGEGEQTFLELVKFFQEYGMNLDEIERINGIVYRYKGEIRVTKPRKLIDPLDQLPMPARSLLNIRRGDVIHMFSSRGCPFRCRFCSSSHFWGRVRYFSAGYVVNEIREIYKKYNPSLITFSDDLFIGNKKRLREIVELIRTEGLHKRMCFSLKVRANLVNEDLVRLLKQMNVVEIGIGLESGSQKTLDYLKDGVTVEQNRRAVELIKKFDILLGPTFVIGSPYETWEDALETLDFIHGSGIDQFNVFTLMPLPGTPLWYYALERGLVSNDMDWSKLALDPGPPIDDRIILSEQLSRQEIIELWGLFEEERRKRYLKYLIKKGLKYPRQIIPFARKKVAFVLRKAWS